MSTNNKSRLTMVAVLGLIIVGGLIFGYPAILKALGRAQLAEVASNGMSIKMVMDSFAMDNDGVYPSQSTAEFYGTGEVTTSNAALKQLHASGNTNSEKIFWVKGAAVCSTEPPDDITATDGKFDPAVTLGPGDNGWSLVPDRTNTEDADHPILITTYLPTSDPFAPVALDPTTFNGIAIVYHIGGHGSIINTDGSPPENSLDVGRGVPLTPQPSTILATLPEDTPLLHPLPPN